MATIAEALTQAFQHHQAGDLQHAEQLYCAILRAEPQHVDALQLLGMVAHQTGRSEQAVEYLRATLRLKPDYAEIHSNLGMVLSHLGKTDEAIGCYQQALRLKPGYAEAHYNLGNAFMDQDNPAQAADSYREALRLKPDYLDAHLNLGNALRSLGQLEVAAAAYREAVRLNADHAVAHNNLAIALQELARPREAAASFLEALRLKPDLADAHYNLAQVYLQAGDFERGWPEYEWRWRCERFSKQLLRTAIPLWDGAPLHGKTLFLYAEQGFGDTLQFVRYASVAKERGARVILGCFAPLVRLLQSCAGIDQVIAAGTEIPPSDAQAPLLSLPGILGTTLATIPVSIPYLRADPELVQEWRSKFSVSSRFNIGIVWRGNPRHPEDRWRSIPLASFAPLAGLEGVQLFSLQKGSGEEQLTQSADRLSIIDLGSHLHDFMDTAAAVRNLDLVITCDTAVAHLAGALGIPVWIALSLAPDWRWLLHRDDSPWYPTVRLFRQRTLGDWDEVFERIAAELGKQIAQRQRQPFAPPPHEIYFQEGVAWHQQGRLNEALTSYERALACHPGYAEAHSNRAVALIALGRWQEATAGYREAIRLKPEFVEAHYNLGNAFKDAGKLDEAAACYRETLRLKPD
jgi:tetratricopeptide (TPR) repeat protein